MEQRPPLHFGVVAIQKGSLYCWVLSKEVSSTIFKVFSMARLEIEPKSPRPLANTLPTNIYFVLIKFIFIFTERNVKAQSTVAVEYADYISAKR